MVLVRVGLDSQGTLRSLRAEGHAPAVAGTSLVCGVVSGILRSFGIWAARSKDVVARGAADRPGFFEIDIVPRVPGEDRVLYGAGAVVVQVLTDLARESPRQIKVDVQVVEE